MPCSDFKDKKIPDCLFVDDAVVDQASVLRCVTRGSDLLLALLYHSIEGELMRLIP